MTTPLLEELRINFPKAKIDYVVGRWSKSVLDNNPNLNRIYTDEEISYKELRRNKYDLVLVLDIGFRSVWKGFKLKPRILTGIDYKNRGFLLDYKFNRTLDDGVHERDVYLGILESMGFKTTTKEMKMYLTEEEIQWGERWFKKNNIQDKKILSVFAGGGANPGTVMPLKRWNRYDELINNVLEKNYFILLLGGESDKEINKKIVSKLNKKNLHKVLDLSGEITLRQTAVILRKSKLLITNDSGPLHIAAAVETPTISVWGPTDPKRLKPYGEQHIAITTKESLACQPCYRHIIGDFNNDCQGHECMSTIGIGSIFKYIINKANE